jgi:hypothetical protein
VSDASVEPEATARTGRGGDGDDALASARSTASHVAGPTAAPVALGRILDDAPSTGPDLRAIVEVPRRALGHRYAVAVPERLVSAGERLRRTPHPSDPPGRVVLALAEDLTSGATVRLRGQGAREGDGAGDLWLRIELVDGAGEPDGWIDGVPGGPARRELARSVRAPPAMGAAAALLWTILATVAAFAATIAGLRCVLE